MKPKALSLLPRLHHHLDLVGFVLFAPAIVQLLLAFQFGGGRAYPWKSSQVIGLFVGAAATFAVWALWNRHRGEDAMIPLALLRHRNVLASALYNACQTSALYAAIYYLPIWFQAVKGASPVMSGVYLLPLILFQLLFASASGGVGKLRDIRPWESRREGCVDTQFSAKNWLYHPHNRLRFRLPRHRNGSSLPPSTRHLDCPLGGVPDSYWHWLWIRAANGTCPYAPIYLPTLTAYI